jgi:hypothetical protein
MADSGNNRALVYLFSGDTSLDGELRRAQELQAEFARTGRQVIIIGDGQHMLSEQEVRDGLAQVRGNYDLFIATHGVNDNGTLRIQFLPPGMSAEESDSRMTEVFRAAGVTDEVLNNPGSPEYEQAIERIQGPASHVGWASAGDIFKMLPPGVQSVMTTACHGSAVSSETQFLPEGVPVFSVAVSEVPASVRDVDRGLASYRADISNNPDPIDMYLNYVVNGLDVGYAQRSMMKARRTTEVPGYVEIVPTQIAVSRNNTIDIGAPLREGTPIAISPSSVDRITDMIMRDSHGDVYFGVTADAQPIRGPDGKPQGQTFTRERVHADVQRLADALGRGDADATAPFMLYKENGPNARGPRLVMNVQIAAGLVGAEIDHIATERGIDLSQAYQQALAQTASVTPVIETGAEATAPTDLARLALNAVSPTLYGLNGSAPHPGSTKVDVPNTQFAVADSSMAVHV